MATVGGFFKGVWRGLDVLRRILHLLLLLLVFGFIIGALRGGVPHLPARGALLIQPYGEIVEQRTGDPITIAFNEARGVGQSETLLWDLTDAIRAAADDDRVTAIALQLDYLVGAGLPTLEEVTGAMREFRASGKKIIAWGTALSRSQYYVAAHADEIYLDPMGEVLIDGYGQYRMYYKGLLDKLAVDVHLFRAGEFKSAAEDLVRSNMSPEDREASLAYLGALWMPGRRPWARRAASTPRSSSSMPPATWMHCAAMAAMRRRSRSRPAWLQVCATPMASPSGLRNWQDVMTRGMATRASGTRTTCSCGMPRSAWRGLAPAASAW